MKQNLHTSAPEISAGFALWVELALKGVKYPPDRKKVR